MATANADSNTAEPPVAIISDMPCIRCGYNLRGLDVQKQCPECGERVAVSMKGRSLSVADRGWVTKITVGATFAGASMPVLFALMYCLTNLYLRSTIAMHLLIAMVFAGGGCGLWLVTAREPGGPYFDSHNFLRQSLRIVGDVAGLTGVAFGLLEFVLAYGWGWDPAWRMQSYMGLVAFPCGLIALMVLLPRYLGVLARRLPDQRLAKHGTLAMLSLPVFVVFYMGIGLFFTFFRNARLDVSPVLGVSMQVAALAILAWPSIYSMAWAAVVYRAIHKPNCPRAESPLCRTSR